MKARDFKKIEDLGLSKKTEKYFISKGATASELIFKARYHLYSFAANCYRPFVAPDGKGCRPSEEKMSEVVNRVDELGLIRRDLKTDFAPVVDGFYWGLICKDPYSLKRRNYEDDVDYDKLNADYEEYVPIKKEQLSALKGAIASRLSLKEYNIIMIRFGLESGKGVDLIEIGKMYNVTRERVRQIESKALRKLKGRRGEGWQFPSFEELFGDSAGAKMAEITDETDIEELCLGVRIFNALKRAGIDTVKDLADYPAEDWPNVRYLSSREREEVRTKMKQLGYSTNIPE